MECFKKWCSKVLGATVMEAEPFRYTAIGTYTRGPSADALCPTVKLL